jgi:hypothetical protein
MTTSHSSFRHLALTLRTAVVACVVGVLVALGGGVAAADPPLFGNASDFVATWRNVDQNTNNVTKIKITPGAGIVPVFVNVYGRCHPTDCNWGKTAGNWASPTGTDRIATTVFSKNNQGYVFATRKVTLLLESANTLAYQVKTDFADPNRQDYVVSGRLART